MTNISLESTDGRSILRIIFEKATFGAPPTHFKVHGDDRWHPVSFAENEDLFQVKFADSSVSTVSRAEQTVEDNGDNIPWDNHASAESTQTAQDLKKVDDVFADLKVEEERIEHTTRTKGMLADGSVTGRFDKKKLDEEAAEQSRIAKKFAPDADTEEPKATSPGSTLRPATKPPGFA